MEYSRLKKVWKLASPSSGDLLKGNPKNDGLGIPVIPSGPLVTSYQLINTILIISPKPKVTIAK